MRQWDLVDAEVDVDSVRLRVGGAMGAYLRATKHGALTIGNTIWFRTQEHREDADLVVHELVHVGQYRRSGRFGFLRNYIWDVMKQRSYSKNHPLEAPAYERQELARTVVREHGGPA